ncbi:MAG TPA: hypothetical protein VFV08_07770 [Puia sp.]|nr:hypothetical protein [Puia sp.]
MPSSENKIKNLFERFAEIRYVAFYEKGELISRQKTDLNDTSSSDSDKYEELLVNPVILTAARQRGNIDCGGLNFVIIGYGNFFQLICEIPDGHVSICLDKKADLSQLPKQILQFLGITIN